MTAVGTIVSLLTLFVFSRGPALAAVTCSFAAAKVTVTSNASETIRISRTPGGLILVSDVPCPGFPTVNTVDTIEVNASTTTNPSANQTLEIDLREGAFAPGATSAGETTAEIEFMVALAGGTDQLIIQGEDATVPPAPDTITLGTAGIALNTDDDADITFTDVENFTVNANPGNDTITGAGGVGTADPFPFGFTLNGGPGNDTETGGAGNDTFNQEGPFAANSNNGMDTLRGGEGMDTVDYSLRNTVISARTGDSGTNQGDGQDGNCTAGVSPENDNVFPDVEGITGGSANDCIRGANGVDNVIVGGPGNDNIRGMGGNDTEIGGPGNDTFNQGLGGAGNDILIGGDGTDLVTYCDRSPTTALFITMGNNTADDGEIGSEIDNVGAVPGGDIENIEGGDGDDFIEGTAADNLIIGGDPTCGTEEDLDGNDTLLGGDGNDTLVGSDDNDNLFGGNGDDFLFGGAHPDPLETGQGPSGSDTLFGDAGDDELNGGQFGDSELGGAGNDIFRQEASTNGSDSLFGGADVDTVDYSGRTNPLTVTLADNTKNDGEPQENDNAGAVAGGDVENVLGGTNNDTITGNALDNELSGNGGVDKLSGLGGDDVLQGGDGDDTGPSGGLEGGDGDDTLSGGAGVDTENGGAGNDRFDQEGGANGGDTLGGGAGSDTADYSARGAGVTITLADNTANDGATGPPTEADNVGAAAGGDIENVLGGGGSDTITGNASANSISGGPGNDTLDGEGGIDNLDYSTAPAGVTVSLADATPQPTGGAGIDTVSDFENLTGSSFGDNLTGDDGDNELTGGLGNDTVSGGAGNDLFNEGDLANGMDVLTGGPPTAAPGDTVDYSERTNPVSVTQDGNPNDGEAGEGDNVTGMETVLTVRVLVLPEGATHSGFTTFVLLANPGPGTATVDLTYLTPLGPISPSSVQDLEVEAGRRMTVNVNTTLGSSADVATKVIQTGGTAPVVAEVSMHKTGTLATMDMVASDEASTSWIIPEGATHSGFATFVTIANPSTSTETHVDLDYLTGAGGTVDGTDSLEVPAGSRVTVSVGAPVANNGCGCSDDVSTVIDVASGEPGVVAGMSIHRVAGGDLGIGGSLGVTSTADTWVVPEGATHSGFHTFVLVANPGLTAATVNITYLTGSQGSKDGGSLSIPAGSRRTIDVNTRMVQLGLSPDDVSTLIDRTSGPDVAVESSIQKLDSTGFVIGDSAGSGGSSISAASGTSWLAAEGATHSGFTTFILIANPGTGAAVVDVAFLTPTGTVSPSALQNKSIPAGSRLTIPVNAHVPGQDVSTLVTADSGKVVVEMSIDRVSGGFSKGRSLAFRLAG